jgi:hypothetical protein
MIEKSALIEKTVPYVLTPPPIEQIIEGQFTLTLFAKDVLREFFNTPKDTDPSLHINDIFEKIQKDIDDSSFLNSEKGKKMISLYNEILCNIVEEIKKTKTESMLLLTKVVKFEEFLSPVAHPKNKLLKIIEKTDINLKRTKDLITELDALKKDQKIKSF